MKTKLYTAIAILSMAFGMTACSSSDDLSKEDNGQEATPNYLAITIRNVGTAPTSRSFVDSDLEYGTDTENAIEKIRFYFFDVNGNAFSLANATVPGGNYIDKTSSDFYNTTTGTTANVEKQVVIDLISETTNALPVSVIAIVNPDNVAGATLGSSMTINSLRDASLQTTSYANSTPTNFVMSNSVYDNNGTSTCAALISGTNIATNQDEARKHPVDIYVERVAAKVRAKYAATSSKSTQWTTVTINNITKPAYKVGTTDGMNGVTTSEDVYAVIDGWGLADESPKASLEKKYWNCIKLEYLEQHSWI